MSKEDKALQQLVESSQLEPFIRYIRFPSYKSLAPGTKIDFEFPITALVGPNGSNKSSVLRALYGSPGSNNLGNFWFSTSVDPIEGGDRPRFIYGYKNTRVGKIVEVIKTRIHKKEKPDYWEPSRPLTQDGMVRPPKLSDGQKFDDRSETRWNPIAKEVIYLDFRSEISAFDKYLYHGDLNRSATVKTKQDFLRKRAVYLKQCIDQNASKFEYYGSNRVFENRLLDDSALTEVNRILGRTFTSVRLIKHALFNPERRDSAGASISILLTQANRTYSEAFAGSGEYAAVMLVDKVLKAKPKSLILLDEPEVSLHPGAQDRLMDFLKRQVKLQKHQVVMCTHSTSLLRHLPKEAISVFYPDGDTGYTRVQCGVSAQEAFFHVGEVIPNKLQVVTEDALGQQLVLRALRGRTEAFRAQIECRSFPGGAEALYSHYIRVFSAQNRKDVLVCLDGDKRPNQPFPNPDNIPSSEDNTLRQKIKTLTGVDVVFPVDGGAEGGNGSQLIAAQRDFLRFLHNNVTFLPGTLPEEFIWDQMASSKLSATISTTDIKKRFVKLTAIELDLKAGEAPKSEEILQTQKRCVATIPVSNGKLVELAARIDSALSTMTGAG